MRTGAIHDQEQGARDVLRLRNLTKKFAGAPALDSVDLTVRSRQVHGLLGHNGSGKSTLIKTLAGYHVPEPGAIMEFDGEPVPLPLRPGQFRELGIAFVHQDLAHATSEDTAGKALAQRLRDPVPGHVGAFMRLIESAAPGERMPGP